MIDWDLLEENLLRIGGKTWPSKPIGTLPSIAQRDSLLSDLVDQKQTRQNEKQVLKLGSASINPDRLLAPEEDKIRSSAEIAPISYKTDVIRSDPASPTSQVQRIRTTGSIGLGNRPSISDRSHKIHSNAVSERLTETYSADALALGGDIFLSKKNQDLNDPKGLALVAHELSHVMQQEQDPQLQKHSIGLSKISTLEREAQDNERGFLTFLEQEKTQLRSSSDIALEVRKSEHSFRLPANRDTANSNFNLQSHEPLGTFPVQHNVNRRSDSSLSKSAKQEAVVMPTAPEQTPSRMTTPMLAKENRGVEKPALVPSSFPTPVSSSSDIGRLADQVYEMITRRIMMDKHRRGLG